MNHAELQSLKMMFEQLLVSLLVDSHGISDQSFILLEESGRQLGFDLSDLALERDSGRVSLEAYPTRYV
jgi:hypothetical protein